MDVVILVIYIIVLVLDLNIMSVELGDHGSAKLGSSSAHPGMLHFHTAVRVCVALMLRHVTSMFQFHTAVRVYVCMWCACNVT